MLPPVIDSHKRGFGHVAAYALRTFAVAGVMVVIRGIIVTGVVALGTDTVAFNLELAGMGVMAVATDHTSLEHLALFKGAQHKHLFPDSPIRVIQRLVQPAQAELIVYLATARIRQAGAQGMALSAGGHLFGTRLGSLQARWLFSFTHQPGPHRRQLHTGGQGVSALLRRGMVQSRIMASGATHGHVLPLGVVSVFHRVVVTLQPGGMAIGALVVPVLVNAGPVHGIAGPALPRFIQPEPALTAVGLAAGIPGNVESLKAAIANINQVLLQRVNPEGVADGPLAFFVTLPGVNNELPVFLQELNGEVWIFITGTREVSRYRLRRGFSHGNRMLGAGPLCNFAGMTVDTIGRIGQGFATGQHQQTEG